MPLCMENESNSHSLVEEAETVRFTSCASQFSFRPCMSTRRRKCIVFMNIHNTALFFSAIEPFFVHSETSAYCFPFFAAGFHRLRCKTRDCAWWAMSSNVASGLSIHHPCMVLRELWSIYLTKNRRLFACYKRHIISMLNYLNFVKSPTALVSFVWSCEVTHLP